MTTDRVPAAPPQAENLRDHLDRIADLWSPRRIAGFNGHDIMVVRVDGAFVWHAHGDTDDFFLVLSGGLTIETELGDVSLGPGDLYVVPCGIRHRPVANGPTELLLIERAGTPNTGDAGLGAQSAN
jgi:mannose-6-phosphate isomerase-like protein (cupin superfamily)